MVTLGDVCLFIGLFGVTWVLLSITYSVLVFRMVRGGVAKDQGTENNGILPQARCGKNLTMTTTTETNESWMPCPDSEDGRHEYLRSDFGNGMCGVCFNCEAVCGSYGFRNDYNDAAEYIKELQAKTAKCESQDDLVCRIIDLETKQTEKDQQITYLAGEVIGLERENAALRNRLAAVATSPVPLTEARDDE